MDDGKELMSSLCESFDLRSLANFKLQRRIVPSPEFQNDDKKEVTLKEKEAPAKAQQNQIQHSRDMKYDGRFLELPEKKRIRILLSMFSPQLKKKVFLNILKIHNTPPF